MILSQLIEINGLTVANEPLRLAVLRFDMFGDIDDDSGVMFADLEQTVCHKPKRQCHADHRRP